MTETLNPSHILVYGKKGRNFFDKYIERGIPVTFYDPPDTHKIFYKTKEELELWVRRKNINFLKPLAHYKSHEKIL